MNKITLKLIKSKVDKLTKFEIKEKIKRKRLKFNRFDISVYLYALVFTQINVCCFKQTYKYLKKKKYLKSITYEGFMYNIGVVGSLFETFFESTVKHTKNNSFSILDSTLIPLKQNHCLKNKDKTRLVVYGNKMVCGIKKTCIVNNKGKIIYVDINNIKTHDTKTIDKSLIEKLKNLNVKNLCADKGYSSNLIRKMLIDENIKSIIPYKKNQKEKLDDKSVKLYKKRFIIENIFKKLKNIHYKYKMFFKNITRINIIKAKIFMTCWMYNISFCFFITFYIIY
jgi:hypothetical protein